MCKVQLKAGVSRIRNRVIARVFHELKLMETWGSGYKRCMEYCKLKNYPKPEWQELGAAIRVTFYPHSITQPTSVNWERRSLHEATETLDLSQRQQKILALFKPGILLSSREMIELLPMPIPERTLRYDLADLRNKKILVSQGKGRATVWKLT